jgi:hypothetical protein
MPGEISLGTIRNVPLARVGPARLWKGGYRDFTEAELRDAVAASQDAEVGAPRVKLAHEHQLDTGEPAFGSYRNLRYDADKKTVFADIKGIPMWLAKVLPTFYPNRSFEAVENVTTSSGKYALAFRAIGSLGIKLPAIKGLADLEHWGTDEMPEGVTLAAAEGTADPTWSDTSIERESDDQGDTAVDIRERLKLPATATDEEVAAALDALEALAVAGSPEALAKVKEQALAEAQAAADAAAAAKVAEAEAAATAAAQAAERKRLTDAGMVMVEAAAYDELKAQAQAGAGAAKTLDRQRREALIDGKIKAGAVAPASRDNLLATLEAGGIDEATIAGLPDGVLPVDDKLLGNDGGLEGGAGGDDDGWMDNLLTETERAALKGA